jgi:hypothetical protein
MPAVFTPADAAVSVPPSAGGRCGNRSAQGGGTESSHERKADGPQRGLRPQLKHMICLVRVSLFGNGESAEAGGVRFGNKGSGV